MGAKAWSYGYSIVVVKTGGQLRNHLLILVYRHHCFRHRRLHHAIATGWRMNGEHPHTRTQARTRRQHSSTHLARTACHKQRVTILTLGGLRLAMVEHRGQVDIVNHEMCVVYFFHCFLYLSDVSSYLW